MSKTRFFPYLGPSRRSDLKLIELQIGLTSEQARSLDPIRLRKFLAAEFAKIGARPATGRFPAQQLPVDPVRGSVSLLAQAALLLQQTTGHRVSYFQVLPGTRANDCVAVVEYEHHDVGMTAVNLAFELLTGRRKSLAGAFRTFSDFSRERVLPRETEALMKAARKLGVPYFQLEQQPFSFNPNDEGRIRPRGLLQLGHGKNLKVLDGVFLPREASRETRTLVHDAVQRERWLEQRFPRHGTALDQHSPTYHLVGIGKRVWALRGNLGQRPRLVRTFDDSWRALIDSVMAELDGQPLCLSVRCTSLEQVAGSEGTQVTGIQLAPNLDDLFGSLDGSSQGVLDEAAESLVSCLFPDPASSRIPVIAVTGTNGKTTTCFMLDHILKTAGMHPGLVSTLGAWVDGRHLLEGDAGTLLGHSKVLSNRNIDAAVLETHHRGIAMRGFAFHRCDVAVCLNVTRDHLSFGDIETVDEMVEIKRALVERASGAAILFADNPHTLDMLSHVVAERVWLVSLAYDVDRLRNFSGGRPGGCCVVETIEGDEHLVLHTDQQRIVIVNVREVPATFEGTARHMVSNAMHAAVAAYEAGIEPEHIAMALRSFESTNAVIPGRLNVYDDLPFRVIIDNAHNPDGLAKVSDFVDKQSVKGRKIVCFGAPLNRFEAIYREMAAAVCGHFDLYFCSDRVPRPGDPEEHLAPILQKELLIRGIPEQKAPLVGRGPDAWRRVFDACLPGDLVMLLIAPMEFDDARKLIGEYSRRDIVIR